MTGALDHQRRFTPDITEEDEHMVTRRTVLTGAAAATAAATVPAASTRRRAPTAWTRIPASTCFSLCCFRVH